MISRKHFSHRVRRTGQRALLVAATASALACDGPTTVRPAFAYDPTALSRGLIYRFDNGRTLRVWVETSDNEAINELQRAVDLAINAWSSVPQFREFELERTTDPANAEILVYDRARAIPIRPGSCAFDPGNSRGYTYFCQVGTAPTTAERFTLASGASTAASVVIRVDRAGVGTPSAYEAIVAHELGHALGIGGHSDTAGDLMFGLPTSTRPTFRDVETLRYVLGERPDIRL